MISYGSLNLARYLWSEWKLVEYEHGLSTFACWAADSWFSGGLEEFKSSEEEEGTAALHFDSSLFIVLFQASPSPAAGVSSSKRNLFAWEWGDSRKFSLSSGSSGGAAHFVPQLLWTVRVGAGSGLRQDGCSHSQGWRIHSAALGRSLRAKTTQTLRNLQLETRAAELIIICIISLFAGNLWRFSEWFDLWNVRNVLKSSRDQGVFLKWLVLTEQ